MSKIGKTTLFEDYVAEARVVLQVLDLGQVVAGNFCGGLLGYFGADVIKACHPPSVLLQDRRLARQSAS